MTSPLDDLRVLDLSQAIAGPLVGRALADLGADVVRVEWPGGDVTNRFGAARAGLTGVFTQMNAGKRGVAIDRARPGGTELILRLAAAADVVIENFRPGVLDRAGLGYEALSAANPRLVMVSISGFGRTGSFAGRRAYAPVIHAESGLLARLAEPGGAVNDLAISLADDVAALHATIGVLAALHHRSATGRGQHLDISMLEAMMATDDHMSDTLDDADEPADTRGTVWTAVGGPLLIAGDPRTVWRLLGAHAGLRDGLGPEAGVEEKKTARHAVIAAWVASFDDRDELTAALDAAGLAWASVRNGPTLLASPPVVERGVVAEVDAHDGGTRRVVRMPYHFSAATSGVRGPAPRAGQHNHEVLADWLGLDDAAIATLVATGALRPPPARPATP